MGQERTLHFGAGTAGNKSLMSFRAGHGITGYAGYCPSSEALMIPTKLGTADPTPARHFQLQWPCAMPHYVNHHSAILHAVTGSSGGSMSRAFISAVPLTRG